MRHFVERVLSWWFVICAVGFLVGGVALSVQWSQTFGGLLGVAGGSMLQGGGALIEGWNMTTVEGGTIDPLTPPVEPVP